MSATFDKTSDTIDSRDVIERIEELEADREEFADNEVSLESFDESEDGQELIALKKLQDQAESSPDWLHGEQLINADYFTQYIEELINDCYEMPKEINSGEWPWRHVTIDYEAAADEAKADYMEVDFNGNTFLIRNVKGI